VDGLLDEREDRLVSSRSIAVHPPARPAFLALPAGAGPLVALVLASLLWGTADVAGKLALVAIPPATLAALRFGVALAILATGPLARRHTGANPHHRAARSTRCGPYLSPPEPGVGTNIGH
jgi:hypothetical protein